MKEGKEGDLLGTMTFCTQFSCPFCDKQKEGRLIILEMMDAGCLLLDWFERKMLTVDMIRMIMRGRRGRK